jgi:type II secretory pathway pseudopilin PulG
MMRCARGRGRREAGLSLVELMIAIVVIAIALIALISLIVSSSQVQQETREKTLAYNAARLKIEEMRNSTFDEIFRKYNTQNDTLAASGTITDSGAPGPSNAREPGPAFDVSGLKAASGDAYPGKIYFPQNYSGTTPSNPLVEDMTTPPSDETDLESRLGLPKDLNRDGDTSDTDVSGTGAHKILPVVIRVRWEGVGKKVTTIYVSSLITSK